MKNKYWYCILLAFMVSTSCFAQRAVTGRVWADSTKPLAGVTVEIENTEVSTLTDQYGNYAISAGDDAVLIFKLTGYRTQEIQVHGRSIIDVNMEKNALAFERMSQKNRVMKNSQPCIITFKPFDWSLTEKVFDIVPGKFLHKARIIGD
jgi:hypothetical protein